jgi:hypothetical protein
MKGCKTPIQRGRAITLINWIRTQAAIDVTATAQQPALLLASHLPLAYCSGALEKPAIESRDDAVIRSGLW